MAEDRIARKAAEQRTFQARFGLFLLTACSLFGAEEVGDLKCQSLLNAASPQHYQANSASVCAERGTLLLLSGNPDNS